MNTFDTEIFNKSSSVVSEQNGSEFNRIDYYTPKGNASKEDVRDISYQNFKTNTSNFTIRKLSAQVMNIPYDEFEDSISNTAFETPMKYLFKEYDIFKRIKEVYDACSCKICRCLTGKTCTPREEHCDCEPCKCQDCTQLNGINNVHSDKDDNVDGFLKETKCDCKPCDCITCIQNCVNSKPFYYVPKRDLIVRNMATKCPVTQNSVHKIYQTRDTLPDRPIPIEKSYSNKKCTCRVCECIVCACQDNPTSYCDKIDEMLKKSNLCKCSNCKCQFSFDNSQPDLKCGCVQSLNNKPLKSHNDTENKPSLYCKMCKNPLYEYVQIKSMAQFNKTNYKRGNILYVRNEKIYAPTRTVLKPVPSGMKENKTGLLLNKDNNQNIKKNIRHSQSPPVDKDNTAFFGSSTTNCLLLNEGEALYLNAVDDMTADNIRKKSWLSSSQGFRSTQAITVSSSTFSCQNKGCSTRVISLPDTNIVDDFTEICSDPILIANQKQDANKHNIYHMQTGPTSIRLIYNGDLENNGNMGASNLLFDHFDKYFSNISRNIEQSTKPLLNYKGVHNTLHDAKQFTFKLTKILQMYEKANSEFVSVSEKLRNSLHIDLNKCDSILNQVDEEEYIEVKPKKVNKTGILSKFISSKRKNNKIGEQSVLGDEINKNKINTRQDITHQGIIIKTSTNVQDKSEDNIENIYDGTINKKNLAKTDVYSTIEGLESTASKVEVLREKKIWDILQRNKMLDLFTQMESSVSAPTNMNIY